MSWSKLVNCTEHSPSVRLPWFYPSLTLGTTWYSIVWRNSKFLGWKWSSPKMLMACKVQIRSFRGFCLKCFHQSQIVKLNKTEIIWQVSMFEGLALSFGEAGCPFEKETLYFWSFIHYLFNGATTISITILSTAVKKDAHQ